MGTLIAAAQITKQISKRLTTIGVAIGLAVVLTPTVAANAISNDSFNGHELSFTKAFDGGSDQSNTSAYCIESYYTHDGTKIPQPGDSNYFATTAYLAGTKDNQKDNIAYADGGSLSTGFSPMFTGLTYNYTEQAITKGDYFINSSGKKVTKLTASVTAPASTAYCRDPAPQYTDPGYINAQVNVPVTVDVTKTIKIPSAYNPLTFSGLSIDPYYGTKATASFVTLPNGDTGIKILPMTQPSGPYAGNQGGALVTFNVTDALGKTTTSPLYLDVDW